MLEEIIDDKDELKEFNLSSRVLREEQRKARERERLEREMAREMQVRPAPAHPLPNCRPCCLPTRPCYPTLGPPLI